MHKIELNEGCGRFPDLKSRILYALHTGNSVSISFLTAGITLKPYELQRKDEINLSANAAKAEKIKWMAYAEIKALIILTC